MARSFHGCQDASKRVNQGCVLLVETDILGKNNKDSVFLLEDLEQKLLSISLTRPIGIFQKSGILFEVGCLNGETYPS